MGDKKYSLSLCMIAKNEEKKLPSLWQSVKNIVDEWIVVDTGSTDKTVEIARSLGATVIEAGDRFCEVLTKDHVAFFAQYGVNVTEGEKIFHFGKARTASFERATKDFIMWLDGDDILIGSDKLQTIIEENLDPSKNLGLHLLYKYEVDQYQNIICQHYRERVFPNRGKFSWVGRIHEIIIPNIETQYIIVKPEDCHVLHTMSEDDKKFNSGMRNTKALLLDLYEQKEEPDPRTLYQLGEAFLHNNKDQALDFYLKYMGLSGWDEERCQAASRIMQIYLHKGDYQNSLSWAYKAVQERPDFPSGYSDVAQAYYALEDYSNCILWADRALEMEQPETMTFVNDKHNRFTPYLLLAASYFKIGDVKKAIASANEGLKYEPLNEFLLNIKGTSQRAIVEEKVTEAYKLVLDYLIDEKELAKASDLFKSIPWSHEDDPRILGLKEKTVQKLVEALKVPREQNDSLELEKLDEELPHVDYLVKELSAKRAKSVFLISSDNDNLVQEYLETKGFEVKRVVQDDEKFDAVVAFNLIDRIYDPSKLFDLMVKHCKPTGLCIVSNRTGVNSEEDTGQVRVYTINSIRNLLHSFGFTVWNSIPLPNDLIYSSFLPGQLKSKKSSIAFICGTSVEEWGPLSIYSGIGGSEEATILLAQELRKQGHEVTVYNNCSFQCTFNGVHWKHFTTLNPKEEMDTAILWRIPHYLEKYQFNAKQYFLWLHDVPEEYWFTEERLAKINKIIVLSKYHRTLLPNIPDEKFIISQNGVDLSQFEIEVERNPKKVIYTSSYDRGLEHLLTMWPDVRKEVPDAELHIFYGWGQWDKMRTKATQREWKSKMLKLFDQPGVIDHGRVGQLDLAKEYLSSGIYAYPSHFEEISCISAMKAQIGGCIPLTTDYAALAETNLVEECKIPGNTKHSDVRDEFKKALIEILKSDVDAKTRQEIRSNAKKKFSWKNVAEKWSEFISEGVKQNV